MRLRPSRTGPSKGKPLARTGPVTIVEKSRQVLNDLIGDMPTKQWCLVPRDEEEAKRCDSLSYVLKLPFHQLAPILVAAKILVVRTGSGVQTLRFAAGGFDALKSSYLNLDIHHAKTKESRANLNSDITRPAVHFISRGKVTRGVCYQRDPNPLKVSNKAPNDSVYSKSQDMVEVMWKDHPQLCCRLFSTTIVHPTHDGVEVTPVSPIRENEHFAPTESQDATDPNPNNDTGDATPTNPSPTAGVHSLEFSPTRLSVEVASSENGVEVSALISPESAATPSTTGATEDSVVETENGVEVSALIFPESAATHSTTGATADSVVETSGPSNSDNSSSAIDKKIADTIKLDFSAKDSEFDRPARIPGNRSIKLVKAKMPTEAQRMKMMTLAFEWGYREATATKRRTEIAAAACRLIAYDCGFEKPPKGSVMATWVKEWDAMLSSGYNANDVLKNAQMGPADGKYTDKIERQYPGFLHKAYRLASKELSGEATWNELALEMNRLSATPEMQQDGKPALEMSKWKLKTWFKENRGKLRKTIERPLLTPARKVDRVEWCTMMKQKLEDTERPFYCAYLDEKWFYLRSGRKKMKYLPLGPHEAPGDDLMPMRRTVSRRFPTKVSLLFVRPLRLLHHPG